MNIKFKNYLLFFIKLAISAVIICFLSARIRPHLRQDWHDFNWFWMFPAAVAYAMHLILSALRWRYLAKILGFGLSFFEAVSLTMQGIFFSSVIPGGAIGGDVVKIGIISKRSPKGVRTEGAFTILMDRVIGMIALFSLALISVVINLPLLLEIRYPFGENLWINDWLILIIISVCSLGLASGGSLFFYTYLAHIKAIWKLSVFIDRWCNNSCSRILTATSAYTGNLKAVFSWIAISLFIHLFPVAAFGALLYGANGTATLEALCAAVIIANVLSLVPIAPAGVGVRDLACVLILTAAGVPENIALTTQLLYTGMLLIFNFSGGLFFIGDSGRKSVARKSANG